jgi:hypothetical protein
MVRNDLSSSKTITEKTDSIYGVVGESLTLSWLEAGHILNNKHTSFNRELELFGGDSIAVFMLTLKPASKGKFYKTNEVVC